MFRQITCTISFLLNFSNSYVRNQVTIFVQDFFWDLYSISLVYLSQLVLTPDCFNYWSFILRLNTQKDSRFVLFQNCLGSYRFSEFQIHLESSCQNPWKECCWVLTRIALNLLAKIDILMYWDLQSRNIKFHLFILIFFSFFQTYLKNFKDKVLHFFC